MRRRTRLILSYCVAFLAGALALGAIFVHLGEATESLPDLVLTGLAVAVLVIGLPLFLFLMGQADGVFRSLDRLRGFIVMMQTDEAQALPRPLPGDLPPEVQQVLDAVDALIGGRLARQALPVEQLESVLRSIPDGIVVINHAGLIGLVNSAAVTLFGTDALTVGTSIYDALTSADLHDAVAFAQQRDETVEATIQAIDGRPLRTRVTGVGEGVGAVLLFDTPTATYPHEIEVDLRLLASPPDPTEFNDDTRLDALPYFVFDLETTGLDVAADSVISVGGVRMAGTQIYPAATIDRLVDPGCAIPPRSTAIHGINDDMVAGAASFPELWGDFEGLMHGTVLVGHNVGFDIAQLRTAIRRGGLEWEPPPFLCTYLLVAGLDDGLPLLTLEAIAQEFGVPVRGRHTALGDALLTAEVFARLVPRLMDRGVETLGAARAFAGRRKDILKQQEQSGWWTGA